MADASVVRRTRKRFTNTQLTMLENLFHQNSHPPRQDREALARAGGMEIKSVTIWFQNKRQTERKSAASNTTVANSFNQHNVHPNVTSAIHTFSLHESPPRPSLDRVASRSELRTPSSHTHHNQIHSHHQKHLYEHLPSSPLYPPISPHTSRDFVEFGKSSTHAKTRRTLEWACEAARLADRERDKDKHMDTLADIPSASAVNPGYHRHHQTYTSAEGVTTSRTSAFPSSSKARSTHRERNTKYDKTHIRKEIKDTGRTREHLARTSSSLTLRAHSHLQVEEDATDSEIEDDHTPSTKNRSITRLSKTSTTTSITSSSSASTPSTSTSISREGSTSSTNTSFTSSLNSDNVEDDAMFKAALALCGLGQARR